MGISRERAIALLETYVKNERMVNHSLASEAVMRALARRLGRDEDAWGIAGLLHDIDVEVTGGDLSIHGTKAAEILRAEGADEEMIEAVLMHNEEAAARLYGEPRKRRTEFEHALAAAETITGLIVATALVYPDRKLSSVKPKSVVKRMKERAFAASVSRENIMECEKLGIPLNEFVELAIGAMMPISATLGL